MNNTENRPIVMIGAGGHATVLADILFTQGREICAVISPDFKSISSVFSGIPQLVNDKDILKYSPDSVVLVNGIGMVPYSLQRKKLSEYFIKLGYEFETIISDTAIVSTHAIIEPGVQILNSSIIQINARIGENSIINTGAIIEHDCQVDENCHIAPRAIICGNSHIKQNVFVGAGATVIQGLTVESDSIIGAGVTLTSSLNKKSIVYGSKALVKKMDRDLL